MDPVGDSHEGRSLWSKYAAVFFFAVRESTKVYVPKSPSTAGKSSRIS